MKSSLYLFLLTLLFFETVPGENWENYTTRNSGLISDKVRTICVDESGTKWFGTNEGLSRFDGETWKSYREEDNLADSRINDIAFEQTAYGPEIWLATDSGVSVLGIKPDAVTAATPYRKENTGLVSNSVNSVIVDEKHTKWFGTQDGLSIFSGDEWNEYTTETDTLIWGNFRNKSWYALARNLILSIGFDPDNGWKYIGTSGGGVSRIKTDSVEGITSASPYDTDWSGLLSDTVFDIYIDTGNVQWYGTAKGAARHTDTETQGYWYTYTEKEGLIDNIVRTIAKDRYGAFWFGTPEGVSRFDGIQWKSYTTNDGLISNNVFDIEIDHDGSIWFATDSGLSHYRENSTGIRNRESNSISGGIDISNYPNPFSAVTLIKISAPDIEKTRVQIFDINGRLIKNFGETVTKNGSAMIKWDGTDQNHRKSASGIYLVKARCQNYQTTRKIIKIK